MSIHVMNDAEDLMNPKPMMQMVTIGDGKMMQARLIGNCIKKIINAGGNKMELEGILFIPTFKKKILSLLKLLDQGYHLTSWTKEQFK